MKGRIEMTDINPENESGITGQTGSGFAAGTGGPVNASEDTEEEKRYGVIYTPAEGEYSYNPYSNDAGASGASASARPAASSRAPEQKKKSRGTAGMILGICAAVFFCVCIVTLAVVGIMFAASRILGYLPNSGSGEPDSTRTADTSAVQNYDGGVVNIADSQDKGSGVETKTVSSGSELSVEEVVALVKDSVVEITTESRVGGRGPYSQYVVSGAGSGVILSEQGMIITNNHVIDGANKISVRLTDGTEYEATLIGTDEEADIAVISITPGDKKLVTATVGDSDKLILGQTVIAIGNPLGELGGTVTRGIVSATEREVEIDTGTTMKLIQTDAAINPGNSGGALFNLRGELIGIVNAKSSGETIEGLGFAIPINTAWSVAENLVKYGYVPGRMIMGLKGVTLQENYEEYYLTSGKYVTVVKAEEGSNFVVGDIITAIGNVSVSSISDIQKALRSYNPGDSVRVRITRQYNEGLFSYTRSGYVTATVTGTEAGSN